VAQQTGAAIGIPKMGPLGFVGLATGIAAGIGGVIGAGFGGWWCDRFGIKDARQFAVLPIVYPFIGLPIFWYVCSLNNMWLAMILLIPVNVGVAIWYGPVYGGVPGLVPPAMRATTSAILLFIINMIGLGGGPTLFGMLSDHLSNGYLAASSLDVNQCKTVTEGMPNYAACAKGAALGLKDAVYLSTGVHAFGILCFIGALFTIRKDMQH
jgi:MFS family permease